MTDEVVPADPVVDEPECGFGRCIKEHVLHCCHTAYSVNFRAANPSLVGRGWRCNCGKESRTIVMVKR